MYTKFSTRGKIIFHFDLGVYLSLSWLEGLFLSSPEVTYITIDVCLEVLLPL